VAKSIICIAKTIDCNIICFKCQFVYMIVFCRHTTTSVILNRLIKLQNQLPRKNNRIHTKHVDHGIRLIQDGSMDVIRYSQCG